LPGPEPTGGRLHRTTDERLLAIASVTDNGQAGHCVLQLHPDGSVSDPLMLKLERPLTGRFFTATPRAGCLPSDTLDLLGPPADDPHTMCYAQLHFG
jgi:hypothetical protein